MKVPKLVLFDIFPFWTAGTRAPFQEARLPQGK